MTHHLSYYRSLDGDDGEWTCSCGAAFGMSLRLAHVHLAKVEVS